MKWVGISGTWRTTDEAVEKDVRSAVRDIIARGDGIVAGGASGVDYFATDEALRLAPDGSRARVIIPSLFNDYIVHLEEWAKGYNTGDPPIDKGEADRLITQLHNLISLNAIIEGPAIAAHLIDQKSYNERNSIVVAFSDELVAFQINKSSGTQDTIDKTRAAGKKAFVHSYTTQHDKAYNRLPAPKPFRP